MKNEIQHLLPKWRRRKALIAGAGILFLVTMITGYYLEPFRSLPIPKTAPFSSTVASIESAVESFTPGSLPFHPQQSENGGPFAYVTFAKQPMHLCNAVMALASLHKLNTSHDRILLYPESWDSFQLPGRDKELVERLLALKENIGFTARPVQTFSRIQDDGRVIETFSRFIGLNLTEYSQILLLDPSSMIKGHMDELFGIKAKIAAPRNDANDERKVSTSLISMMPSTDEVKRVTEMIDYKLLDPYVYDALLLNGLYPDVQMLSPQVYDLHTTEFADAVKPSRGATWNAQEVYENAKMIRFTDKLQKPWMEQIEEDFEHAKPACGNATKNGLMGTCDERRIWTEIYESFAEARREICGLQLEFDKVPSYNKPN